jgi:Domain of unknown function (DUF1906)
MVRRNAVGAFSVMIAVALATTSAAGADPLADGRIAIADLSFNLLDLDGKPNQPAFDQLRQSGVLVIGRYYARCPQGRKRMIDVGINQKPDAEVQEIFHQGFAILSIYQFNSREGKFADGNLYEVCATTKQAELNAAPSNIVKEGILDAEAALSQANAVGQPDKTVIYFGVDYNFQKNNSNEKENVLAYFREIKKQFDSDHLNPHHYRVGAYADGDALELLTDKKEPLIDIAWLVPSASYSGTSRFHRSGLWDLFQSGADIKTMTSSTGKCAPLDHDVNVQNPDSKKDFGFWGKQGAFPVPADRTTAIYNQRRFICDAQGLQLPGPQLSCDVPPPVSECSFVPSNGWSCYDRAVRVKPGQDGAGPVVVDRYDNGTFNAPIERKRLTSSFATKPDWNKAPTHCN